MNYFLTGFAAGFETGFATGFAAGFEVAMIERLLVNILYTPIWLICCESTSVKTRQHQ